MTDIDGNIARLRIKVSPSHANHVDEHGRFADVVGQLEDLQRHEVWIQHQVWIRGLEIAARAQNVLPDLPMCGRWNDYAHRVLQDLMRDKTKAMPTDPEAAEITALRVWHCNYASLAPVEQYPNLNTLVVATYPDADLEPIAALVSLKYLSIIHLPGVTDLGPLVQLTNLRTVRLSTLPSWDSAGKVTEVDSLRPLARLPALTHLELFGVRPTSKSLHDLEDSASLTSVRVSKYPKAEVTRFREVTGLTDAFAPSPGVSDWT